MTQHTTVTLLITLLALAVPTLAPRTAAAAAPSLADLSPRGLQAGGTTTLNVSGAGLSEKTQVLLALPIVKQAVRPGAQPNRIQVDVTLDANVPAGIYHLRIVTDEGVSNPVAIGVDQCPQVPFATEVKNLPVALHGDLTAGTILETSFAGKAGQQIVVDLEARRLGGALNPVLEIHRPGGVLLASSQGQEAIAGDARLDIKLPQDGTYRVRLHDVLYRGAAPGFFRLKIGALRYADWAFPLGAKRGSTSSIGFASTNLPATTRISMTPTTPLDAEPAALRVDLFSGGRPAVAVGDMAEVAEVEGKPAEAAAPAGFTGRLSKPGEVDRFVLRVKPGMRLRFDVRAERIGSPLDAVLTVQKPDGTTLASGDDQGETIDPGFEFTVPGGVDALVLLLSDQLRGGGPTHVYHITATEIRPDFRLTALADRLNIPRGGNAVLRVRASRAGYTGPIRLSFAPGMPPGVATAAGEVIPAGATDTLLTLRADANASGVVLSNLMGEGSEGNIRVRRAASVTDTATTRHQPWLRYELPLAVTRPEATQLAWQGDAPNAQLIAGVTYQTSVKLTRTTAGAGPVRLSLLTSQITPLIAEGERKGQPDVARTLRLEAQPTIPPGQDTATLKILVPPTLRTGQYALAVQAELLNPAGQVVGTAVTPSRLLPAVTPSFTLELVSPAKLEARAGKGPAGKLVGRIRRVGFPHPVTLTLAGLPQGVPAPSLVVPGDKTDFEFPLTFPASVKPGELKGVKLVGTSQLAPKNVAKAANEIALELKIVPGDK
jgi:hypothetical protein